MLVYATTRSLRNVSGSRMLHASTRRAAVSNFLMPAMSPTMTEGGISSWKKKEGESFAAGDILLEIETDKATIDVEAQEDGIIGKIIVQDGAKGVQVGKVIALLAEEGDDISNLKVPDETEAASSSKESSTPAPSSEPAPKAEAPSSPAPPQSHSHISYDGPMFPSVLRLLQQNGVSDFSKIKGTGVRGMLTKGDVLAFLGKASSPLGTYKEPKKEAAVPAESKPPPKPLTGAEIRQSIVAGIVLSRIPPSPQRDVPSFDSVIADYLPQQPKASHPTSIPPIHSKPASTASYFDGLI